jgi:hypothetical protein
VNRSRDDVNPYLGVNRSRDDVNPYLGVNRSRDDVNPYLGVNRSRDDVSPCQGVNRDLDEHRRLGRRARRVALERWRYRRVRRRPRGPSKVLQ